MFVYESILSYVLDKHSNTNSNEQNNILYIFMSHFLSHSKMNIENYHMTEYIRFKYYILKNFIFNPSTSREDKEIILINQGKVFAIENLCPHMNLPLDVGQITDQDTILCPYHNSEFCFKTGDVRKWVGSKPEQKVEECKPLNTISVHEEEDYIWVTED